MAETEVPSKGCDRYYDCRKKPSLRYEKRILETKEKRRTQELNMINKATQKHREEKKAKQTAYHHNLSGI